VSVNQNQKTLYHVRKNLNKLFPLLRWNNDKPSRENRYFKGNLWGGVMGTFRLPTEPILSLFRKTDSPPSLFQKQIFFSHSNLKKRSLERDKRLAIVQATTNGIMNHCPAIASSQCSTKRTILLTSLTTLLQGGICLVATTSPFSSLRIGLNLAASRLSVDGLLLKNSILQHRPGSRTLHAGPPRPSAGNNTATQK
jgi:hypothetical protein